MSLGRRATNRGPRRTGVILTSQEVRMCWDYRIVKHRLSEGVFYSLHECYYVGTRADAVTKYPVEICTDPDPGESPSECLVSWLRMMIKDIERHKDDTLDADRFGVKRWRGSEDSGPLHQPLCVAKAEQSVSKKTGGAARTTHNRRRGRSPETLKRRKSVGHG